MIKHVFRWEDEDYLKARMEPWICYGVQEDLEQERPQRLYNQQKAAGWKTVRGDLGSSIWAAPANQKAGWYQ